MNRTETTIFPFLLGVLFIIALVVFLTLLNHAEGTFGVHPDGSVIALLKSFVF
jgi:hypothetical protein